MTTELDRKAKHRYSPPESLDDLKNALYAFPSLPDKIKELIQCIKLANEEANALRNISSLVPDGTPYTKIISDPTSKKAIIIERYDNRIAKFLNDIDLITYLQQVVGDALLILSKDEYEIIHARYFAGLRWKAISDKTNYCLANCRIIHDKALDAMLEAMKI